MPERKCIVKDSVLIVVVEPVEFEIQVSDVDVLPAVAVDIGRVDAHSCFVAAILAGRHTGDDDTS